MSPLIVLDDPVPGSDREHRNTFADGVISALLADGRQVLVCTHDPELAGTLQTVHQHLGVAQYQAELTDPSAGSVLRVTGDSFDELLQQASQQLHSPQVANRRIAGNALRIATERLAKHVIVAGRRRGGDSAVCVADFEGRNLQTLGPKAREHALSGDEPGKWTVLARILNDANHDSPPPHQNDLKQCYGNLQRLKRTHKEHDPNLMKP